MIEINKIYNENNCETMARMDDNSIDLTVTSPPYDNLRDYKGYSFDFERIAQELFRITKEGGIVVWVVGDATVKGSETGSSFKQALYFMQLGFNLHDTMIYRKENPIPLTHNRYEQEFEYMYVFSKGKPKTFKPLLVRCINNGSYKNWLNSSRVKEAATRNRMEITKVKEYKQKGNVWTYTIGSTKGETGKHPAPFPEKLAQDHIISWSNEGDLVYDPFMGSGTVAKMCIKTNRNYVGSEISKEYCELAEKRLKPYKQEIDMFYNNS